MPRTYKDPRPSLRELGFERVAEILHSRLANKNGRFWCFVLPTGTTYLRATCERRTPTPSMSAWVGTYTKATPIELIESDLLDRLREINAATTEQAA